jgi:hypothetical protein
MFGTVVALAQQKSLARAYREVTADGYLHLAATQKNEPTASAESRRATLAAAAVAAVLGYGGDDGVVTVRPSPKWATYISKWAIALYVVGQGGNFYSLSNALNFRKRDRLLSFW